MNRFFLSLTILFCVQTNAQNNQISLSPSYANQSFYSLQNGEVLNSTNNDWDIAFHTDIFSSTIRINDGQGVELFTYPLGDTSAWNSINASTPNILTSPMYNSDTSWNLGAFERNQTSAMMDYGWGVYNVMTHYIVGDSLYLIKTVNDNWKKLWLEKKVNGTYEFKHADLDGSNLVSTSVPASNYSNKRFVYYSIDQNLIIDREPALSSWDITFTKYITPVQGIPYGVTGVLNNVGIKVADADNIPSPSIYTNYNAHNFYQEINTVGYDWKTFDMSSFSYILDNDRCFFIKDYNQNVWRIIFTQFEGTSTGNIEFNIESLSATSVSNIQNTANSLNIYPNPSNSQDITLIYEIAEKEGSLNIYDLSGREVFSSIIIGNSLRTQKIPSNYFEKGMYIVSITFNNTIITDRLIVN